MKTIGLIGGLTWYSTLDYYRMLNEMTNEKLGSFDTATVIVYSVNFGEIKLLTEAGDWNGIAAIICDAAKKLESAGAGCMMIGANTMHHIADKIQAAISIPVIHIADVVGEAIAAQQITTVALLGTKYTMQYDFYHKRLAMKNIRTIIPGEHEIEYVNNAIYGEMSKGNFLPATKQRFLEIIASLKAQGAEGVILGCTEIPILIKQEDSPIPVFDTTRIHAQATVDYAAKR